MTLKQMEDLRAYIGRAGDDMKKFRAAYKEDTTVIPVPSLFFQDWCTRIENTCYTLTEEIKTYIRRNEV